MKNKANVFRQKQLFVILLLLILSIPFFMQTSKAQAVGPSLQDKAVSFLTDVVQLDLSDYTISTNQQVSSGDYLSLNLDGKSTSFFGSHIIAGLNFYNNSVRSCGLSPDSTGLPHANPITDRFNATIGLMERYQKYTSDPQVQEMVTLLEKIGSEKNATEASGNLMLRITCYDISTSYSFRITFNGAEYTGITINYANKIEDFDFNDNRQIQKIGNTSINISEEQAINIAKEYLKTYTMNFTFGNGTTVKVSNLTVTGVYQSALQTSDRWFSNTLYPLWNIQLNVNNMPSPGLQGIGVWVWANDGKVQGAYRYTYPMNFDPFLDTLSLSLLLSALAPLITLICIAVAIIVFLVLYLRKPRGASK